MKPLMARALTRLYTGSWRARYGREFEALLEDVTVTPMVATDVISRALWSRRVALGISAAVIVAALFAALQFENAKPHAPSSVTVATACRTYSSTTRSGWATQSRCLD